jgi:membrane-associated phospholipid phosphatase
MAWDILDKNFFLGCKAFVVRETVFRHPRDFRTGHVWTHTNGTVFFIASVELSPPFYCNANACVLFLFIFYFFILLTFFYFFCLRLPNVLAIALDYCRICESTKTLLCDDCLTVM